MDLDTPLQVASTLGQDSFHEEVRSVTRRVYFAFDPLDIAAVNEMRGAGRFVDVSVAGFADTAEWEQLKRLEAGRAQAAIDEAVKRTSVTVACIGPWTASRRWVNYELRASWARGNGLIGIFLPGMSGYQIPKVLTDEGAPVYEWSAERFGLWVEEAAARAGH
jgi:hypothetical protein